MDANSIRNMDYEEKGAISEIFSSPDSSESPPESSTDNPPPPDSSSPTPPSSPPPSSPPPSSPPPSSPPPSSPPPSSPPPLSPPPSSPPPSSPPPSSPPPKSPPPDEQTPPESNPPPSPPPEEKTPAASPPPNSPPPEQKSPPSPTPGTGDSGGSGSPPTEFTPPPPLLSPPSSETPPIALSPPSKTPPAAVSRTPPSAVTVPSPSGDSLAISPPPTETSGGSYSLVTVGLPLLLIAAVVIVAIWALCAREARKRRKSSYYMDPRKGSYAHDDYFGGAQPTNWQSGEHVMNLPPPPGGHPGGGGGGGGWHGPPMTSAMSGEMTSHFSGSQNPSFVQSPGIAVGFNQSTFTYEDLANATNGFAQSNLLGQGGFGYVHKGVLPNGKEVAVKSLKTGSGQGEREFQAEVEIISRVHHRHLVSLVGYCIAGGQRMLVYEFVPNKTLEYHLHGADRLTMDFASRLRIALGSAKGLAYLHEDCHPKIIHRDIKAANILLDYNFEAMVADFGLAKLSSDNYTHVSTRVMGTFGYLAPEYASSGKLTEKSDVFSFGVMLLELITGRRPVDTTNRLMEDSLVDWARPLMKDDNVNYEELVDPRLGDDYNRQEMARMIACAAASIRHSARRRPKMSQIVRALEGDASLDDLNDGLKTSAQTSTVSSEFSQSAYHANMENFKKLAFESGTTSEYGLNPSSSSDDSQEMPSKGF